MLYAFPAFPPFTSFDDAEIVFEATDRYQLPRATPVPALLPQIQADPLCVYAYAVHRGFVDLASLAARFLKDFSQWSVELLDISGQESQRLVISRKRRMTAVPSSLSVSKCPSKLRMQ